MLLVLHNNQCSCSNCGLFVVLQRRTRNQSADNFQKHIWVLQLRGLTGIAIEKRPVKLLCWGNPVKVSTFESYQERPVPVCHGKAV